MSYAASLTGESSPYIVYTIVGSTGKTAISTQTAYQSPQYTLSTCVCCPLLTNIAVSCLHWSSSSSSGWRPYLSRLCQSSKQGNGGKHYHSSSTKHQCCIGANFRLMKSRAEVSSAGPQMMFSLSLNCVFTSVVSHHHNTLFMVWYVFGKRCVPGLGVMGWCLHGLSASLRRMATCSHAHMADGRRARCMKFWLQIT